MRTPPMVILIAAAIFAPSAFAGSASAPNLTDASGDVSNAALDVTSAWITNNGDQLLFTIKLGSLASPDPAAGGAAGYRYAVSYTVAGIKHTSAATVWAVETTSKTGNGLQWNGVAEAGVGTTGRTTQEAGAVNLQTFAVVDPAAHTLTIKVERSTAMTAGTVVSGFTVTTYQSVSPVSVNIHPAANTWTKVDATGTGSNYVIA